MTDSLQVKPLPLPPARRQYLRTPTHAYDEGTGKRIDAKGLFMERNVSNSMPETKLLFLAREDVLER